MTYIVLSNLRGAVQLFTLVYFNRYFLLFYGFSPTNHFMGRQTVDGLSVVLDM